VAVVLSLAATTLVVIRSDAFVFHVPPFLIGVLSVLNVSANRNG
jgi:hypothetical protein